MLALLWPLACGPVLAQPTGDLAANIGAMGRSVDPRTSAAHYAPRLAPIDGGKVRIERDVAYGADAKETLDVFSPATSGKGRPILIFVHSGAFRFDDKSRLPNGELSPFYDNVVAWAVAQDMVGVNMRYPLAPQATYPRVQRDIVSVVAWARSHAASLGAIRTRW